MDSGSRICDPDTMCESVQEFEMLEDMEAEEEDQFEDNTRKSLEPSSSSPILDEDILEKAVQDNSVEVSDGTDKEYKRCDMNQFFN